MRRARWVAANWGCVSECGANTATHLGRALGAKGGGSSLHFCCCSAEDRGLAGLPAPGALVAVASSYNIGNMM